MKRLTALRRRLKDRRGFTLVEMLMTTLILLMVSAVVAGGVPSAANAYFKIVDASNAQILFSNTVTSLRSELAVATNVETDASGKVKSFTSGGNGWKKEFLNSNEGIKIKDTTTEGGPMGRGEQLLVPKALSGTVRTSALISKYDSITYNKSTGVFSIKNLRVEKGNQTLAEISELTVRSVLPKFSA